MTFCLFVSLLAGLCKYYWLELHDKKKKKQKMGLGPSQVPLNLETDLDHSLDTKMKKNILIFPFTYYVPWQRCVLSDCYCKPIRGSLAVDSEGT